MRSDQLQKWALGAEIAGAVAVVITLGFLTFQMRENTNAVQAQTYQALMEELNNYRALTVDPGLAEVEGKFRVGGWQGLTRVEKLQLRSRANIRWGIYESAYFANERGVLGEPEWERFVDGICRGLLADADLLEPEEGFTPMIELLTPEFVDYIESSCE